MKAVYQTWRSTILSSLVLLAMTILSKLGWVIFVWRLFHHIREGELSLAYMFAGLVCILLFCDLTTTNNYYANVEGFIHEARGAIISILLKKILALSQYTVSRK